MTYRILAAAAACWALALPARGQDAPKGDAGLPATVAQLQPLGKVLADVKAVATALGGKKAAKEIDDQINEKLGDKGLSGIDLTRPVGAYQVLKADIEDPAGVVVIPVTSDKEFLDLLKRHKVTATAAKDDATLYELEPPEGVDTKGKDIRLRLVNGYAYVGINLDAADLKTAKLPAAAKLVIPGESALLVVRTYMQRVPKDVQKKAVESMDKVADQLKGMPLPPAFTAYMTDMMKVSKKYTQLQYDEGDTTTFKLNLDPKTLEAGFEYALKPLAGTGMAKDIAARKPTTNQFGGLLTDATAAGFVVQMPLFLPELRSGAEGLVKLGEEFGLEKTPEEFKPAAEAVLKGLARTFKGGDFDLAGGLNGPTADGKFALSLGVSFDDPSKVEAELRKLHAAADKNVQNLIKLDVVKAGGTNIHKANIGPFLPPEAQAVFGDESTMAIAFAPKGLYVTLGKDSVGLMKTALAAGPKPARVLDIGLNAKRMRQLAVARGNDEMRAMFPDDAKDEFKSLVGIEVAGGAELTAKAVFNLKLVPKPPVDE